jgi:hypothetical protein
MASHAVSPKGVGVMITLPYEACELCSSLFLYFDPALDRGRRIKASRRLHYFSHPACIDPTQAGRLSFDET